MAPSFRRMARRGEESLRLAHHARFHTERVFNLAVRIGREERAELDVIRASALLHDIARAPEDEGKVRDHAAEGAKPDTLEAKILRDADRSDAIGAIGIARVFTLSGWKNVPIHHPSTPPKEREDDQSLPAVNHIHQKLLKIKDTLNTDTAKRITEERQQNRRRILRKIS